jgi:hypothetical protein
MFDLDNEQALVSLKTYHFEREDGLIRINVHNVIEGKSKHKAFAVPTSFIPVKNVEEKYWGFGDSEDAGLKDCLNKIKSVPYKVIFPRRRFD